MNPRTERFYRIAWIVAVTASFLFAVVVMCAGFEGMLRMDGS